MNKISTWFAENTLMASLAAVFIVSSSLLGWLAYSAWDEYAIAFAEYSDKSVQLAKLSQQKPFPNKANLAKLEKTIAQQQSDLQTLVKELQRYIVPPFGELAKVKPQDMPQRFQDALRKEVTRIKTLAENSGTSLPSGFYLGMEEYENKPPSVEESVKLAKQLTLLSWIGEALTSKKGIIIAEFSRTSAETPTNPSKRESLRKPLAATQTPGAATPFETITTMRVSFRSNQSSFRELINTLSTAPYFLVIENLQLQNSASEPPSRSAPPQGGEQNPSGGAVSPKLPIIVGRELLNVSLKIRALEFPSPTPPAEATTK